MTVEELLDLTVPHTLLIHKGQVFIQTRDEVELEAFRKLGCRAIPWYSPEQVEARERRGRPTWMGWEVHLLGALEEEWVEVEEGEEMNVTPGNLLAAARARIHA